MQWLGLEVTNPFMISLGVIALVAIVGIYFTMLRKRALPEEETRTTAEQSQAPPPPHRL